MESSQKSRVVIPATILPDGRKHPTYITWSRIKQRVKRGYCDMDPRWNSFALFYLDMGERPKGRTIDRIDGTKGYWPGNCRWASDEEQQGNRKDNVFVTWEGKTLHTEAWGRELGITGPAFRQRLKKHGICAATFGKGRFPDEIKRLGTQLRLEERANNRQFRGGSW